MENQFVNLVTKSNKVALVTNIAKREQKLRYTLSVILSYFH
jgi:hypothetical protein